MNCPAIVGNPPCHAYRAHGSHVTGVEFLLEDQYVVSTGGEDRAVIQWVVKKYDPRRGGASSAAERALLGSGTFNV